MLARNEAQDVLIGRSLDVDALKLNLKLKLTYAQGHDDGSF